MKCFNRTILGLTVLSLAGCGSSPSDRETNLGLVALDILEAPSDVQCLVVTVTSPSRVVQRNIEVTPGVAVTASISGLPTGEVSLLAAAYPEACSELTGSSVPSWLSDPPTQTITLVPGTPLAWSLVLRPSGVLVTTVDWQGSGCVAGTSWCDPIDSTKAVTCGSDGKTLTTTTSAGKYCLSAGANTTQWVDCIVDAHCSDGTPAVCSTKLCGTDNKCATKSVPAGTACGAGSCDGSGNCVICAADQYQCSGATLQRCRTDRNGWETVATCSSAALCSDSTKQCLKCEKNKIWCSDVNTRQSCSADGLTQTASTKPSDATPYCTGAGVWVACLTDANCVQPASPCQQATCSTSNICTTSNKPASSVCAGNGKCDSAGACIGPTGNSCNSTLSCQGRSCCESRLVTGGTFPMGRGSTTDACPSGAGFTCSTLGYETPEHNATVSSYYLDTFEVTVGRFRTFMASYSRSMTASNAGTNPRVAGSNPSYTSTGWNKSAWDSQLPTDGSALGSSIAACTNTSWPTSAGGDANENRAVNCITWYEAFAFCIWDGGRLPTAAEWEYAAAGGANNLLYPWGSAATDGTRCNCNGNPGRSLTLQVGSFPDGAGLFGQRDLSGSFEEWALDFAASDWYSTFTTANTCNNCADLRSATLRETRGGSYAGTGASATYLRAAAVNGFSPTTRDYRVGFRCARDTTL